MLLRFRSQTTLLPSKRALYHDSKFNSSAKSDGHLFGLLSSLGVAGIGVYIGFFQIGKRIPEVFGGADTEEVQSDDKK